MPLTDELHVIKWLSQYGALPKAQVVKLLNKPPGMAEKILRSLKRDLQIADTGGGYYLGLDPLSRPDQRIILAILILIQFIDSVDPMAHYPASYPAQIAFLKGNTSYEIVVIYENEGHLLKLLQPEDDLKYIIVLPRSSMAASLRLPKAPCLFATVDYNGQEEPTVTFYTEAIAHESIYANP